MFLMNKLFSIIVFFVGLFVTYALYSMSETGDLTNYSVLIPLAVAAFSSALISVYFHKKVSENSNRFLYSLICSYLAYICLLVVVSIITGDFAEVIMWSLVIIMFGVPFMMPLTCMSWLAVYLFFKKSRVTEGI